MRLPGWLRVALSNCAGGVLQVRQSQDRQTVHVLSYVTSMPDVGDMVTAWEHRTVDLRSGWVDATRYAREPDDDSRKAEMRKFWEWVERQTAAPLLPFGPASVAWQLWDPNQSDTQKAPQPALRDGVRVYHNERLRDGAVELVRDGQVVARHGQAGATALGGGAVKYLWLGDGPQADQVVVVAGALRPSVLVMDVRSGRRLLHTRI